MARRSKFKLDSQKATISLFLVGFYAASVATCHGHNTLAKKVNFLQAPISDNQDKENISVQEVYVTLCNFYDNEGSN